MILALKQLKRIRRSYYNIFSKFYDKFVALHSQDTQSDIRQFLANQIEAKEGLRVLDICTGTGTLLLYLAEKVGKNGLVVGVDFSRGMLEVSRQKTRKLKNVALLECDVGYLPFKTACFDVVTCSHAFYELKGETQDRVLREIIRILKPGKFFFMMEHDVPENRLIRILLYIRLFSMGAKRAISILKHERELLQQYFASVQRLKTPSGRSKIWVCTTRYH